MPDKEPLWAAAARALAEGHIGPPPRRPVLRPESVYETQPVPDAPAGTAEDQRILARDIDRAASLVSGLGEHRLANQLWALSERVRAEARLGRRYVKDSTGQAHYQRPGWGSLRGRLTVSDDWDSDKVNDEIARALREDGTDA